LIEIESIIVFFPSCFAILKNHKTRVFHGIKNDGAR